MRTARPRQLPASDPKAPWRALLSSLALETSELANSADQLQDLFGELVAERGRRDDETVRRAQILDGVVQRLEGMQVFLATLSREGLDDLNADRLRAALGLRLTRQARRLGESEALTEDAPPAGDCDLF